MEGTHYRLYQITQTVKGDALGNALMDEVLTNCFDFALGNGEALDRLVKALNRFNSHLSVYSGPIASGLFRGTPQEVSRWAGHLTSEILANGAQ